jgi:nicotinate-nucleotide pyrophosphorylase (carboxylating)
MSIPREALREIVRRALEEDRAFDDVTTRAVVPAEKKGVAHLVARQNGVLAGIDAFAEAFRVVAESVEASVEIDHHPDGVPFETGTRLASVTGPLGVLLSAERVALNFAQHLSGIATLTRLFVEAAGTTEIRDTRKTTPGLRALEKDAVRAGGGTSHRDSLAAAVLIKDNHIIAAGGLREAVNTAKAGGLHVEVECDTLEQVDQALAARADELLLDNMDIETLQRAVELARGRAKTEASGGVTLNTVAAIATTGVDSISVGALTHSAPAIDLSLEVEVL